MKEQAVRIRNIINEVAAETDDRLGEHAHAAPLARGPRRLHEVRPDQPVDPDADTIEAPALPPLSEVVGEAPGPTVVDDRSQGKQGKAKGRTKAKAKRSPGTARGLETMLRSSYRTQLDLTALAATKANIMISLNGFILSVLTLSGPFVLVAEPLFTVPIAIFIATSLASIIFAVLAARPRLKGGSPAPVDFRKDRANLLVFEDFSALSERQYAREMDRLMHDNARIYRSMSRQLHMLGTAANRKFRMLTFSYTAFLAGLSLSSLLLLGIGFYEHAAELGALFGVGEAA